MLIVQRSALDCSELLLQTKNRECEIACLNSQESTVISGPAEAVAALETMAASRDIRFKVLGVPFAFHSSQIDALEIPL